MPIAWWADNRIAREILRRNERGRWQQDPSKLTTDEARKKQDDEIFGTARNVNCVTYVNAILTDYVQAILGTVQADSDWSLDPRMPIQNLTGKTPTGGGNAVSIEFNTVYRWHAPISRRDTQWLEDKMAKGLPGKVRKDKDCWDSLSQAEFYHVMEGSIAHLRQDLNIIPLPTAGDQQQPAPSKTESSPPVYDPKTWKLAKYETVDAERGYYDDGAYERGPDGKFKDEDLARILKDATREPAGAFGARNVPSVFRGIDAMTMAAGRDTWKICTLNEFRRFLGLKTFSRFEEWNDDKTPDPRTGMTVAQAAEALYGHPDNIELYVGLMAESTKETRIGAGLCGGFTLTRAILSDATALVRADRFFNASATTDELTSWGLQDAMPSKHEGSYGGIMNRLIRNNLPDQYAFNDVMLLFPFQTPQRMRQIFDKLGKSSNYCFNEPAPPKVLPSVISELPAQRMGHLVGKQALRSNVSAVFEALHQTLGDGAGGEWQRLGSHISRAINLQGSARRPSLNQKAEFVDVARDVITPITAAWLASLFGTICTGTHSAMELFGQLSDLYIYLHASPQPTYESRTAARETCAKLYLQVLGRAAACMPQKTLIGSVKTSIVSTCVGAVDLVGNVAASLGGADGVSPSCYAFYKSLVKINAGRLGVEELAADCLQAFSLLGYVFINGGATALDGVLPHIPHRAGEVHYLKMASLAERAAVQGNVKAANELVGQGIEHIRLNFGHDDLRARLSKNRARRASLTNGSKPHCDALDETFKLGRDLEESCHVVDHNRDAMRLLSNFLHVVLPCVLGLRDIKRADGQQGSLNRIDVVGALQGIPSMVLVHE